MITQKHRYAVIMAGGTGTRLWPLSRKAKPKQFHALTSTKTLLEETYQRVQKIVPADHIYISTTKSYSDAVLKTLPDFLPDRLIIEPAPRGTAPAITLVAQTLLGLDPEATVATIHSDHAIDGEKKFIESLSVAFDAVETHAEKIVVVGINPTHPSTELGYIHMGAELPAVSGKRVFSVDSFREKPDLKTAKKYLADWAYLWNAGYFIFSAKTFAQEAQTHMPEIAEGVSAFLETKNNARYEGVPNEAVDQALIEKLPVEKRLVVPSEMGWADIGTWDTLFDFLRKTDTAPCISGENHLDEGSKNCLVYGNKKLVATIGLENVIIVDSEDALLVAKKGRAKDVKKIIETLKAQGKTEYL